MPLSSRVFCDGFEGLVDIKVKPVRDENPEVNCYKCYFFNNPECYRIACTPDVREDQQFVYFVKED